MRNIRTLLAGAGAAPEHICKVVSTVGAHLKGEFPVGTCRLGHCSTRVGGRSRVHRSDPGLNTHDLLHIRPLSDDRDVHNRGLLLCRSTMCPRPGQLWRPQMDDYITRALNPTEAPSFGVPGDQ